MVLDPGRRSDWISFGVGVITCFTGLLRPGEWAKLCAKHVSLPGSLKASDATFCVVLALLSPKNSRTMGRQQVCLISNTVVVRWLVWLCSGMHPDTLLFAGGTGKFRSLFQEACDTLGIGSMGLTPASLRAGGATELFQQGVDISRLRFLGRWRSIQTLDHYVQEAAAALVLASTPPAATQLIEALLRDARVLRRPPTQPWPSFFSRRRQQQGYGAAVNGQGAL